jgi:GAF domain-containing protein
MPYVRCRSCGLTSYAPRSGGGCPNCGAPMNVLGPDATKGDPDRRLDALLRLTRELLDADAVILSEIRDGCEVVKRAAGEWPPLVTLEGASLPLADTFCQRLLEGRIGNVIRDAQADETLRGLGAAKELGIRSWIGVPIVPSDAELYMLCCLAREARPSLGAREVRLLRGLAESALVALQAKSADAHSAGRHDRG